MPWINCSRGWAAWIETDGHGARFDLADEVVLSTRRAAGPLKVHSFTHPTAFARLRAFLTLTGLPPVLPEWAYGHQFPDPEGMIRRWRADGVRTVVWIAPWVNLESRDGQYPPDKPSAALHAEPAPNYEPEMFVKDGAEPFVARWWMGTGSPVDFTDPRAEHWWREQAKRVLRMGVTGIKADDGEGWYLPDHVRFADGTTGAQHAWGHGLRYRRSMQRALDEVHPGDGVLFGRPGWTGQQAVGMTWGGDQPSDFWSLRTLVSATLTAAASGFSNWSHDVGGYLGERLVSRASKELLLRWVQFGCFSPLMHAIRASSRRRGSTTPRRSRSIAAPSSCTSAWSRTSAPRRRPRPAAGCRSPAPWR